MAWWLYYGLRMNNTSIPLASYEFNYWLSITLTMVDFNLTIKNDIHGLMANYGLIMNKTSISLASYEF